MKLDVMGIVNQLKQDRVNMIQTKVCLKLPIVLILNLIFRELYSLGAIFISS